MLKKKICLFLRKPLKGKNFSVENFYYELFRNFKDTNIKVEFKVCPLESRGILSRIFLCIWAYFNQGNINHICGDINFISIFMEKKKTINTFLDFYSMKRLKGLKKLIYKFLWIKIPFLKSEQIITISNKTLKELDKLINLNNKKNIHVIGISVSKRFKKKLKNKMSKIPKILVVGTSINKNILNIITSLKGINCELVIIGELNKNIIDVLKINKINYRNLVSINNNRLIYEYEKSDMLLFPSNYEGFGVPILEAQSVGRPVITSKIEPMKFVAGNGAIFVHPQKISQISNAVKNIINKQKYRNLLIKKGFDNVKRFNKEAILKKHLRVYNETINNL